MLFRKFILTAVLALCGISAISQQYKYKELVDMLGGLAPYEQLALLRQYIAEEGKEPNADYRLAMIHYRLFQLADPLISYDAAMAHAREAELRLIRSKQLVNEGEVKRRNEYYAPMFKTVDSKGRPYVEFALVQAKMQAASDSVRNFQAKMPAIYKQFTKSVRLYGDAVKSFASIGNRYKSLEDLLLLYDGKLESELNALKISYDSSVVYLDAYKRLIAEFPIPYKQNYKVRPIEIYHLDGFTTGLNFLTEKIDLWNYSAWVDRVQSLHKNEIVPLQNKLMQNEQRIQNSLATIASSKASTPTLQKLDKDLVFNLNNYDKNSLPMSLLNYKLNKQEYAALRNRVGSDSTIDIKLGLYSSLLKHNRVMDSLSVSVKQSVKPLSLQKHASFIEKNYGGAAGVDRFVNEESAANTADFRHYQDSLKKNLLRYINPPAETQKFVKLGAFNISLAIQDKTIKSIDNLAPATLKRTLTADGATYLAGIHRMNKKIPNVMAFVARVNPDGKTGWIKEYNLPPDSLMTTFSNFPGDLSATQEGVGLVITSQDTARTMIKNRFVYLSEKGEEKIYELTETALPRQILYQERSNTFTIVFKGIQQDQSYTATEKVILLNLNVLGDLTWRREIEFAGTVESLLEVRNGYLVIGNYTSMRDGSGKELKTKSSLGQANPYIIKLGITGEVMKTMPIESPKSIDIDHVVKVSDESINLLGKETSFTNRSAQGKLVHMLMTFELKTICSDF